MIAKVGSKYIIYSQDGSKKLGEFDSEAQAKERLRVIEYFKQKNKKK
jgi:hypothetical protein